jgi:hypothetical protein
VNRTLKAVGRHEQDPGNAPRVMAGVATLYVNIGQQLGVSLVSVDGRQDVRGRWDRIKWGHYEPLANGIARAIAALLKLPQSLVTTTPSMLLGTTTADPRLVIEVPIEYKAEVASEKVQLAIQYVVDRVTGTATLDDDGSGSSADPTLIAANDAAIDGELHAAGEFGYGRVARVTDEPRAHQNRRDDTESCASGAHKFELDAAMKARLQSVAKWTLSKVGGATLPVPCRIEIDGLNRPPLVVAGRCADKPAPQTSGPKRETFECYVDGFIRSRHTIYLVDAAGNGAAREVAMASGWERCAAEYASHDYRERKFLTTIVAERRGEKVTRELESLVPLPR